MAFLDLCLSVCICGFISPCSFLIGYLFKFEFPLRYRATPRMDGSLRDWRTEHRLPDWGPLDRQERFAEMYGGWNEGGLFVAARVQGRQGTFPVQPAEFWKGDNLRRHDRHARHAGHQACLAALSEVLLPPGRRGSGWPTTGRRRCQDSARQRTRPCPTPAGYGSQAAARVRFTARGSHPGRRLARLRSHRTSTDWPVCHS